MKKMFYPVIHVDDLQQTLINANYAFSNGADGIFLINHTVSPETLLDIYRKTREKYPDKWIGLNLLGLTSEEAMRILPDTVNGLWTDNAEIEEDGVNIYPQNWYRIFKITHPDCSYFGGVAFKYQRPVTALELAAEKACACMDVICTSGPGTGLVADIEHVKRLYNGAVGKPLALASGVTPENISDFLLYMDHFLVASGISKSFRMLDPGRIKLLADKIKEYNRKQNQ